MSLSEFVEDVKEREKTLTVFTAREDEQLFAELERFFEVQNISVRRGEIEEDDGPQNFVVLHQAGDAVAVSTLEDVRESLFLGAGNARLPGDASLPEGETPDVISSLGNTTFAADGEDRTLLTQISHYILELAFETGGGTLHAGVQRLSAVDHDSTGFDNYAKLAHSGVEVHLYGAPDADIDLEGVAVHAVDDPEIESTRFVAFDGAGEDGLKAAMVAADPAEGTYRGFWTFETELTDDVLEYIEATYGR